MIQQLFKLSSIFACLLLINPLGLGAEPSRPERLGKALLDLSVEIASNVQPGEEIEATVTYSNKTAVHLDLDGAFQIGKERSGLIAVVQDEKGETTETTGKARSPLSGIRLEPNATQAGTVRFPRSLTPVAPGKFSLTVTYHRGALVLGHGYEIEMEVTSTPVSFEVGSKVSKGNEPENAIDTADYEDWKHRVQTASGQQQAALLDDSTQTAASRGYLGQAVSDQTLPLALRLQVAERLKGKEFPHAKGLVDIAQSGDEESEITIAVIDVLPWMEPHAEMSPLSFLRTKLEAAKQTQTTNLRYRLAVVNALSRSGGLEVQDLVALAEKQQNPHIQLLILSQLLSKGQISNLGTYPRILLFSCTLHYTTAG